MDTSQDKVEDSETRTNTIVVSWARDNTTHFLRSVIDQEAENWEDVNLQTWKIATYNIVKRLKDSSQMGFLVNDIRRRLNIYSGNTCITIENQSEPIPVYTINRNLSSPATVINWNKTEIDILRPKHRHQLAEDISRKQPLNTRVQALNMLLNFQLSDIVSGDCWSVLQKHLLDSLCDPETEIFELSLKIHSKLLTLSYNIMKEGFSNLIEGLRSHYSRKYNKCLPVLEQGLDFENPVHCRIIKISHTILETTLLVPEYWVRMGERCVEEIISSYFALLSMHSYDRINSKTVLFPFHVIATIDPYAKWCRRWFHCGLGRKICLSLQSQVRSILKYALEVIVEYITTLGEQQPKEPNNSICKEAVRIAVFSHCVNVLCCFAAYKKGHSFFPLTCKIKEVASLSELLCLLIRYLNNNQEINYINLKIICNALITLVQKNECPLISLTEVFLVGLEPMKEIIDHEKEFVSHIVPFHTIEIIEALCKNETGVMYLVEGKSNVEHEIKSPWGVINNVDSVPNHHPANIIMNYTDFLLRHSKSCEKALISLLRTCTMLFKYYDLCSALFMISVIDSAAVRFQLLQSQVKDKFLSMNEKVSLESEELCKCLINFLASVVSQPGGLLTVVQCGIVIINLIPFLLEDSIESWESPQFRRLISMLSTIQEVEETMSAECPKSLGKVLSNLWTVLEDQNYFVNGIERYINTAILHYMDIVHTFGCTLLGTKIFFSEYEESEDTLLESGCNPSSPSELMMFENSIDPWHKIAMLTLQALTRNLDSWLFLESKFGIEKRLVQVQMQNVSSPIFEKISPGENDKKIIIIDECSLLRHSILTRTNVVSIPPQEYLPDFNTETLESFMIEHCSEKFEDVTKNISKNISGKSELQQLLEDSSVITNHTNWIVNARKAFRSMPENINQRIIVALVEKVSQCNAGIDIILNWIDETWRVNCDLCPEEILGIKISVRHGVQTGLLDYDLPNDHLLKEFIQHTHTVLKIEKSPTNFRGYDWFLSSVFFLCEGNLEECRSFLNHFVTLQVSLVMWPSFAESKGIQHFCIVFSSLLDIVISSNVPFATAALHAAGISWGTVCYSWLSQCFWTILKWNQVSEWLTLCILNPPDIIIYFCAALLKNLEPRIIRATINEYIWDELVHEHFISFSISEQMSFLDLLAEEHRSIVLPKLLQAVGFH